MTWFEEQLQQRKTSEDELFSDAFYSMAGAVTGKKHFSTHNDKSTASKNAINEILNYYGIKSQELPEEITDFYEQLEYMLRPHGLMHRTVKLNGKWYKNAIGPMLATTSDGSLIALIPKRLGRYEYLDTESGEYEKVTRKNVGNISEEGIVFYKPLPLKKLTISDFLRFMWETISAGDIIFALAATLAATLVGMLIPVINNSLFSSVAFSGNLQLLLGTGILFLCASISSFLFNIVKDAVTNRISLKMDCAVEAATMMRMLSLPVSFFGNYSSGQLSSYLTSLNSLSSEIFTAIASVGISSVFSILYITQISSYAPGLTLPALLVILTSVLWTVIIVRVQMKVDKQKLELSAKESGLVYSLITGIQKIRIIGSEKRAYAKWGNIYSETAALTYRPPMIIRLYMPISIAITSVGTLIMYYLALKTQVSVADYYAFNSAYGMVLGAFSGIAGISLIISKIKPIMDIARPLLDTEPEIEPNKQIVSSLGGGIQLSHISFRYGENTPYILDDVSVDIPPRQYVAIVGKTGCGKSTLMRLLLGFEKAQKGAIFYDCKDIDTLDLKSLRKNIGTVIQNGKLFNGDIYSNITISHPQMTQEDAWAAAERAGIADDIREMPMGMNTLISEDGGGISGGQKQRILIARALSGTPGIIMFDEATSALDNLTQKTVTDTLDSLKCTRIVIAHRLSTIRNCDRILVLDNGHIAEDGSYDELISKNGIFRELVERQQVSTEQ